MLRPTPTHTPLPKVAAVDPSHDHAGHDDPSEVHSLNTDQDQPPAFLNSFDNSRPSSPSPAAAGTANSASLHPSFNPPTRVLSPKISLESIPSRPEVQAPPPPQILLRTPPESPVKDHRRDSFKRQSFPRLSHQQDLLSYTNGLSNLSSPPSSPTQASSPGATLPPKLSQSLADHPLFRGCTPASIHQLASRMHIRHYHPQDYIIRRSEQSSAMFYVLRGAVKVVSNDNEATYYEIKENNFFGDVGVLYRVPRSMDVVAKNRCTIAILSGDDLVKAMEQSPEMAKAIGYQTQERYQMYLKRRQSVSVRRNMDSGTSVPAQCQDDSRSESFAKCDAHRAIEKVPLFQSCSTEVIHLLSLKVEPRKYNLGESIISRGEIGREMFFIVSGVVEVLSDDNLKVLARFHEGQFFGEIAVLLDVPRIANVRAVSEVEVFVLTKENLEAVFHAVPGAADTITNEGHRLYQNWLQTFTLQGEDQIMDDGEARSSFDADSQSSGVVVPQGTDQESTGLSSGSIHPIEAGHPAAISVLPMTFSDDFSLGNRLTLSSSPNSSSPIATADQESGTLSFAQGMMPESVESPKRGSFDQDVTIAPAAEDTPQAPANRNPTIRGLQESNPKRRRASVAVWSQQDLLKLAEAATAKVSLDVSHMPSAPSAMSISSLPPANDDTEHPERPKQTKRSSSTSTIKKAALVKMRTGPATFQDLEECIVVQILNALPLGRLLKARRVCKTWNRLILEHDDILQSLDLSGHKKIATDAVLEDLCNTVLHRNRTRTVRVSLRDCFSISDRGLKLLAAHMPAVQELDLHSCWNVTDAGFKSLSEHCPQVRSIDFSNCRKLSDETIFALYPKESMLMDIDPAPKKPHATHGSHGHIHSELQETVEQDRIHADTSMDEVQEILTHRPSFDEGSDSENQSSYDVEHKSPLAMDIESPKPAAKTLTAAAPQPRGCPLLARLNLSYCKNLTDRSVIHLSQYGSRQLESLNLQRCTTITSEAYISLNMERRRELEGSMSVEPCFPRLRELYLSDCTFLSDHAIVSLAPNVPRMEVFSLSFCCALTDVAVEAVGANCRYLKKLDLSFCGSAVSDASLYQLAQFDSQEPGKHTLEDLEIRGCVRVTEQGVRQVLNGCVNLKRLNVSGCSGIGTGDLVASPSPPPPQLSNEQSTSTSETVANTNGGGEGSNGSWASLSNGSQTGELARKMNALKRGKEWALAQQRPGLQIIV